ncbi:MAG: FAD-binding oxidoreductase, partial [Deltaproteobacteria bacterium]|nr:FAD-binding oxidoreductase [Deltaproteobacteria bacterium]
MEENLTVCDGITKELEDIVGKKNVLTDEETLQRYAGDESWAVPKLPDWVVKVKNTDEVQKVVQLANHHKVPV